MPLLLDLICFDDINNAKNGAEMLIHAQTTSFRFHMFVNTIHCSGLKLKHTRAIFGRCQQSPGKWFNQFTALLYFSVFYLVQMLVLYPLQLRQIQIVAASCDLIRRNTLGSCHVLGNFVPERTPHLGDTFAINSNRVIYLHTERMTSAFLYHSWLSFA